MEEEKFIRIPLVRQRWLSWTCEIEICHHEKTMPIRLGRTPARPEQGRSVAAMGASAVMLAIWAASCLAGEVGPLLHVHAGAYPHVLDLA